MINLSKITKLIEKENNSENDRLFLQRIFEKGLDPYIKRLKQYGFYDKQKVLDAGCGFGQWSLALAKLNEEVYSCDADTKRISFLEKMVNENKIDNVQLTQGFIDNLAYHDAYFDAVFCYGVLFLTSWKKSLSELVRVLKPGGKLYINANGLGWYKKLWYSDHNKADDYLPQKVAAEAWLNTYKYKNSEPVDFPTQIIIEPSELLAECNNSGLTDLQWDGEGLLGNPNNKETFFQKEYFSDIGVYEIIGIKK